MLQKVSEVLAKIHALGRFITRRTSSIEDLHLEVKGAGTIGLPVSQDTARKLCALARPARYGLKEKTLLDPKVRDTYEIVKSRVRIDKQKWNQTLLPQLEHIRRDLSLPEGCSLNAQLHNMLVYEPGQFFAVHQDSEKTDDMVGTLIVILPSVVKGGTLVVKHSGETVTCRGSDKTLTFIAFYADCRHEIRPVKEGYRVALTYNLIIEGEASRDAHAVSNGLKDALARAVQDYFKTPVSQRWHREELLPDRLVYLLDHEYTQKGLGWNRLKNEDAVRVAALKEVARRLDCGILLSLADVHEMWSCEEEDYGWYGRYDEDDEEEEEDKEPIPIDLEELEIALHHCIGSDRGLVQIVADIDSGEVCSTKGSDDFEPYESEHEGYMGNYGNTLDRWYHRAAVVVWPQERTFGLCANDSAPGLALAELLVERQCDWAKEAWQSACEITHPQHALASLKEISEPMLGLIESCHIAKRPDLQEGLLGFLTSQPTGSPITGLVHLMRSAHQSHSPETLRALQLTSLHQHGIKELSNRLSVPVRQKDDWSIPAHLQCTCQLCQDLTRFLAAPDQTRYEWPLAKHDRAHVHQTIDDHDLPVNHTTRRSGRPYTLVLTKTKALFQRETVKRKVWERDVRWLKQTAHAFGNG